VRPLTRRRFLAAGTGGALGLSVGGADPAVEASTVRSGDRVFTNQSTIANGYGGVLLSKGVTPASGQVWRVQRVYWNVNFDGNVATNGVQTYLYRLPAAYTTAQAMAHMASSLDGWLGCCGNSLLTGNGDMRFDANDVTIGPRDLLWLYFIVPADYNGFVMAAGMSVWEQKASG
jgi:hypothetical protein